MDIGGIYTFVTSRSSTPGAAPVIRFPIRGQKTNFLNSAKDGNSLKCVFFEILKRRFIRPMVYNLSIVSVNSLDWSHWFPHNLSNFPVSPGRLLYRLGRESTKDREPFWVPHTHFNAHVNAQLSISGIPPTPNNTGYTTKIAWVKPRSKSLSRTLAQFGHLGCVYGLLFRRDIVGNIIIRVGINPNYDSQFPSCIDPPSAIETEKTAKYEIPVV